MTFEFNIFVSPQTCQISVRCAPGRRTSPRVHYDYSLHQSPTYFCTNSSSKLVFVVVVVWEVMFFIESQKSQYLPSTVRRSQGPLFLITPDTPKPGPPRRSFSTPRRCDRRSYPSVGASPNPKPKGSLRSLRSKIHCRRLNF